MQRQSWKKCVISGNVAKADRIFRVRFSNQTLFNCILDFQSTINSSKRLLIFVNPKSGSGTALKTFKNKIFPALRENSIAFELFQTDFAGHAADIISKKEDLMQFNAIVIISGDGLIFEVLNSIVSRKDGEKLLKSVPFAIVPCGSGNGLLSSVFVYRE